MISSIKTIVVAENASPYVLSVLTDEDMVYSINKMESPALDGATTLFVITCVCVSPFRWRRIKKALVEKDGVFGWTK